MEQLNVEPSTECDWTSGYRTGFTGKHTCTRTV